MTEGDDRFERRLVEETSQLRVEIAGLEGRLTERSGALEVRLTEKMGQLEVRLTGRIAQSEGAIRKDINGLFRWAFVFWIGQFGVLVTLIVALR